MSPLDDPAITPGKVADQSPPRLTAAEARATVEKAREARIRPILDKGEVAILSAIQAGNTDVRIWCTTGSKELVNEVREEYLQRGFKVNHHPATGWPSEIDEHFAISF